jgi:hypothetical protein
MLSAEYDLRYMQAAVNQLEDYLLSEVLFWPIGVRPPTGTPSYPKLTLGGLLLARARAKAMLNSAPDIQKFEQLDTDMNRARTKWIVNWAKKAVREFQARLTLWGNYIEDYRMDPDSQYDRYAYEVSRRVQLELLGHESSSIPTSAFDLLKNLDFFLQTNFVTGQFIWENNLKSGFPADPFWYLYGRLPSIKL